MKFSINTGLSAVSHPVFLPLVVFFGFAPNTLVDESARFWLSLIWIAMLTLIVPAFYYFRFKKEVNVFTPSIYERSGIYLTFTTIYFFTSIVMAAFSKTIFTLMFGFFLAQLILFVVSLMRQKWSWHAAGWGYLLAITFLLKQSLYVQIPWWVVLMVFLVCLSVLLLRKIGNAHTWLELLMGLLVGFLAGAVVLFNFIR